MAFSSKEIGAFPQYTKLKDLVSRRLIVKILLLIMCVSVVIRLGKVAIARVQQSAPDIGLATAKFVGETIGEPMQRDEMGQINALIVGYAGEDKRGAYLTDTIMLASFDPQVGSVSFISIPRDLFVEVEDVYRGRVNGLYRNALLHKEDEDWAAKLLAQKVEEITGVEISYYMMVNFDGFVSFIDEIGGVDIVVPQTLHDPYYPGPNDSYQTFHIDAGEQHLDGETALKYARSRKTTSDFSRAIRQQQVIKATMQQIIGQVGLTNIPQVRALYEKFVKVVETNVSIKQILGLLPYMDNLEHFFSFVYTADCDLRYLEYSYPGCFLRFGIKENFNGAAVLLPEGASAGNISYYKKTQDFAFWVVHNQAFLAEQAKITILNGIDKEQAKTDGYGVNGVAFNLSQDLLLRGFDIVDVDNAEQNYALTTLVVPGDGWYPETTEVLKSFVDIAVVTSSGATATSGVTLILGNDYLSTL